MRIGQGYDVHRVGSDRALVLGGVEIRPDGGPHSHSDGDVLLHAIGNALLGAAGLGDLGELFPSSSEEWRDASGGRLVGVILGRVHELGLVVGNVDATVLAERPRLAEFREPMRESVARLLGVGREQVNVKFGTGEGVGPVGRGEAIEALAVVLLTGS